MVDPRKIVRNILIGISLIGLLVVSALLTTKKYSFKEYPILKWLFIILACSTLLILIITVIKKITAKKPIPEARLPVIKPITLNDAFAALKELLVSKGWVRAVIEEKKIIPNENDFEFGSHRSYWERDGMTWIKKLDLKLRLKGPLTPQHLIGTHKLEKIPLTSKKAILGFSFDFLNRTFTLSPDKNRRYFPQAVELTPQERQIGIIERAPWPDIEELKRMQPKEEPEQVRLLREMVGEQRKASELLEEAKKPVESK